MSWIEFDTELRDHWKIERLSETLKIRYAEALGLVSCLWTWTAKQAPKGDLGCFTDDEIDHAARWEGAKNVFRAAMKECQLIDKNGKIHDWHKHGLRLLLSSRNRVRKFRERKRNPDRYGNATETLQKRLPYLTVPNLTVPNPTPQTAANGVGVEMPYQPPDHVVRAFNSVWEKYPENRRSSRQEALEAFQANVIGEAEVLQCVRALENYLVTDEVARGIVKGLPKWLGEWKNYIKAAAQKKRFSASEVL